jgi:hypothetical protein
MENKMYTKEPLSKSFVYMVNDTEFKIIDTNEKSPLKLTTPEK